MEQGDSIISPAAIPDGPESPSAEGWDIAHELYPALLMHFGTPAELAAQELIRRRDWCDARMWFGALERLVRRLLLILSVSILLPAVRRRWKKEGQAGTRAVSRATDMAVQTRWGDSDPTSWAVRFSVTTQGRPPSRRPGKTDRNMTARQYPAAGLQPP